MQIYICSPVFPNMNLRLLGKNFDIGKTCRVSVFYSYQDGHGRKETFKHVSTYAGNDSRQKFSKNTSSCQQFVSFSY